MAVRRTRVRRGPVVSATQGAAVAEATQLVDAIQQGQLEILRLQKEVAANLEELYPRMVSLRRPTLPSSDGSHVAERYRPSGRSITTINPRDLWEMVDRDTLLDCVKVSVTDAKKVLSGKELQSIATVTPAEKKPETVRVKPVAPTKKGK